VLELRLTRFVLLVRKEESKGCSFFFFLGSCQVEALSLDIVPATN
jgi:hypothetical protein